MAGSDHNYYDMSNNKGPGSIEVTVISATLGPRGGSESDAADTYATVILGGEQFSTKVAKDHGALPVWNEKHALDFDRNGAGAEDLIAQIFAAYAEAPRLLAVARVPLSKVVEAREETSLHPLHQPSEGYECGQLKLTLKRNSLESKTQPAIYGANGEAHPSAAPPYPPPVTAQKGLSFYPEMSSYGGYGGPPKAPGDEAAHALSSLSIDKDREQRYGPPADGPPSNYSPLNTSSSPYPSQGLPYLASPISGVVTTPPYAPPSPAYTHPPPSADSHSHNKSGTEDSSQYPPPSSMYPSNSPYPGLVPQGLNLPENLDVPTGGKEKTKEFPYPSQYYGGPPPPNSEGYSPSAPSEYPPTQFNESNPGAQPYPNPYGALAPALGVPYPQPESYDGQGKQKTKKEKDPYAAKYEGTPSGYPPTGDYPPSSGSHDQSALPVGYPPEKSPPAGGAYPGVNVKPGEPTSESPVSSSAEGGVDGEKGFKKNQLLGMVGGYAQQAYGGSHSQQGYPQAGYPQAGYGHQPGYPQPGYPSHGYAAPNYPPAYPGHGYAPEAYPSHGYGAAPGYVQPYAHGGHGGSHHAPAPYGGGYGAPMHGGHGHYKQHKGGHKGYKHKKMKKMKKGHYLHFQQPYGYGGHHGKHGKHGKHK